MEAAKRILGAESGIERRHSALGSRRVDYEVSECTATRGSASGLRSPWEARDWYARKVYIEGQRQYKYTTLIITARIPFRLHGLLRPIDPIGIQTSRRAHRALSKAGASKAMCAESFGILNCRWVHHPAPPTRIQPTPRTRLRTDQASSRFRITCAKALREPSFRASRI